MSRALRLAYDADSFYDVELADEGTYGASAEIASSWSAFDIASEAEGGSRLSTNLKNSRAAYRNEGGSTVEPKRSPRGFEAQGMSEPLGREELAARLETVEARAETRQAELSAKIDRLATAVSAMTQSVDKSREESKRDNAFTRWSIGGIAVASALTIIGIVAAIQGTMTAANGNVLSALQAGLAARQQPAPPTSSTQPVYSPAKK